MNINKILVVLTFAMAIFSIAITIFALAKMQENEMLRSRVERIEEQSRENFQKIESLNREFNKLKEEKK